MFRGLLVVVVLGLGTTFLLFVLVALFWWFVVILFSFWFDLCFRFLCLLVGCGCVCFSLRLSVLGGLLLVVLVVGFLVGLCLLVLVYVAVYSLFAVVTC